MLSGTRHVTNPSIGPSIGEMSIGMTNSLRYMFILFINLNGNCLIEKVHLMLSVCGRQLNSFDRFPK